MNYLFVNHELLLAMPGGTEWILIFVVILLFFGGRKIPELMSGIGRGIKELNEEKEKAKKGIDNDVEKKDK
ncbi:MAG: Sec-independent protein translocase subunit TatA/TatB [Ginsengibacter sp.]